MRLQKRAVEVEGFYWTGGPDQEKEPEWLADMIRSGKVHFHWNMASVHMTLPSGFDAQIGDWIIKDGENIAVLKPDEFANAYEESMSPRKWEQEVDDILYDNTVSFAAKHLRLTGARECIAKAFEQRGWDSASRLRAGKYASMEAALEALEKEGRLK